MGRPGDLLGDTGADFGHGVGAPGVESNQGQAGGAAYVCQKRIAILAAWALVGRVVQFDGAQHRQVAGGAKNEIEMLGADLVEGALPGLPGQAAANRDGIRDPHLAEELKVLSDGLIENAVKGAFRRREECGLFLIGKGLGLALGLPLFDDKDEDQQHDYG